MVRPASAVTPQDVLRWPYKVVAASHTAPKRNCVRWRDATSRPFCRACASDITMTLKSEKMMAAQPQVAGPSTYRNTLGAFPSSTIFQPTLFKICWEMTSLPNLQLLLVAPLSCSYFFAAQHHLHHHQISSPSISIIFCYSVICSLSWRTNALCDLNIYVMTKSTFIEVACSKAYSSQRCAPT